MSLAGSAPINTYRAPSELYVDGDVLLSLATAPINTYRAPSELYVDGDVLLSQEGTTQGNPTIPLIRKQKSSVTDVMPMMLLELEKSTSSVNGGT